MKIESFHTQIAKPREPKSIFLVDKKLSGRIVIDEDLGDRLAIMWNNYPMTISKKEIRYVVYEYHAVPYNKGVEQAPVARKKRRQLADWRPWWRPGRVFCQSDEGHFCPPASHWRPADIAVAYPVQNDCLTWWRGSVISKNWYIGQNPTTLNGNFVETA